MAKSVDAIKDALRKKKKPRRGIVPDDLLSTGSTLLNLALSGCARGGFLKGHYFFLVGDSESGKTWLTLTCFAEATCNFHFDDYRLIFDDVERGALMNIRKYFGRAVEKRMETIHSETIEDFYDNLDDAVKDGRPFIYVLDSMDALSSEDEEKKQEDNKKARRSGKQVTGSYGDGKAKKNASYIRKYVRKLARNGSILIVINQTRDNINPMSYEKKTRSGGHALKFYAASEMWSSVKKRLTKEIRGEDRKIGIISQVNIKKNRLTGQGHKVLIPIFTSLGIDDVGSCVDFLIDNKHWSKASKGGRISAPEFSDDPISRDKLIKLIEEDNRENELHLLTAEIWRDIVDAMDVKRKRRYA